MVLVSAVAHAVWNFLFKKGGDKEAFIWLAQIVMAVMFMPLAIVIAVKNPIDVTGWIFVLGTGILHAFYFIFLGRAYASGDLSEVYPIARGTGPAVVPLLGAVILGEHISLQAVMGILTIVVGVFTVYWSRSLISTTFWSLASLKNPSISYSLLTGVVIACYSIWDKVGVSHVSGFLYMHLMATATGLLVTPYILKVKGKEIIKKEWTESRFNIIGVSILTFGAYGLVLSAMEVAKVSYVWPVRESSILVVILLGRFLLNENLRWPRVLGVCLIVVGVGAIGLST